jgi:hypothetical protein
MQQRTLIDRVSESTAFGYLTILILQIKVIWGMWSARDLSPGDTSYYFSGAHLWYESWANDLLWSPLYTAFYGSLLHLSPDAAAVTLLHRVLIVLGCTTLVLMLMRRILGAWATTLFPRCTCSPSYRCSRRACC